MSYTTQRCGADGFETSMKVIVPPFERETYDDDRQQRLGLERVDGRGHEDVIAPDDGRAPGPSRHVDLPDDVLRRVPTRRAARDGRPPHRRPNRGIAASCRRPTPRRNPTATPQSAPATRAFTAGIVRVSCAPIGTTSTARHATDATLRHFEAACTVAP